MEFSIVSASIILVVISVLYSLFGYFFPLIDYRNSIKNLFSVSFVSLLGFVVWLLCLGLDDGSFLSYLVWVIYYFYQYSNFIPILKIYEYFTLSEFLYSPPKAIIIASLIPSLSIWLGMVIKIKLKEYEKFEGDK